MSVVICKTRKKMTRGLFKVSATINQSALPGCSLSGRYNSEILKEITVCAQPHGVKKVQVLKGTLSLLRKCVLCLRHCWLGFGASWEMASTGEGLVPLNRCFLSKRRTSVPLSVRRCSRQVCRLRELSDSLVRQGCSQFLSLSLGHPNRRQPPSPRAQTLPRCPGVTGQFSTDVPGARCPQACVPCSREGRFPLPAAVGLPEAGRETAASAPPLRRGVSPGELAVMIILEMVMERNWICFKKHRF